MCSALANMTELRDGFNGVGFSQGVPFGAKKQTLHDEAAADTKLAGSSCRVT